MIVARQTHERRAELLNVLALSMLGGAGGCVSRFV